GGALGPALRVARPLHVRRRAAGGRRTGRGAGTPLCRGRTVVITSTTPPAADPQSRLRPARYGIALALAALVVVALIVSSILNYVFLDTIPGRTSLYGLLAVALITLGTFILVRTFNRDCAGRHRGDQPCRLGRDDLGAVGAARACAWPRARHFARVHGRHPRRAGQGTGGPDALPDHAQRVRRRRGRNRLRGGGRARLQLPGIDQLHDEPVLGVFGRGSRLGRRRHPVVWAASARPVLRPRDVH